jgi:hypothetical protein
MKSSRVSLPKNMKIICIYIFKNEWSNTDVTCAVDHYLIKGAWQGTFNRKLYLNTGKFTLFSNVHRTLTCNILLAKMFYQFLNH